MIPIFSAFKALSLSTKFAAAGIILVFLAGLFVSGFAIGYTKGKATAQVTISKYEQKKEAANTKAVEAQAKTSDQVITKYVDRIQVIHDQGAQYEQAAQNIPDSDTVSNQFVSIHDHAAADQPIEPSGIVDATSSGIKLPQVLTTVTGNYSICHKTEEQLKSLQDWITGYNAALEQTNKDAKKDK